MKPYTKFACPFPQQLVLTDLNYTFGLIFYYIWWRFWANFLLILTVFNICKFYICLITILLTIFLARNLCIIDWSFSLLIWLVSRVCRNRTQGVVSCCRFRIVRWRDRCYKLTHVRLSVYYPGLHRKLCTGFVIQQGDEFDENIRVECVFCLVQIVDLMIFQLFAKTPCQNNNFPISYDFLFILPNLFENEVFKLLLKKCSFYFFELNFVTFWHFVQIFPHLS